MFTGLIQSVGKITAIAERGGGREIMVEVCGLPTVPQIGASIALSGVCQTVIALDRGVAKFYAAPETLRCTTLGRKNVGELLNLEAALKVGDALDGHLVSGHVDAAVAVLAIEKKGASQLWRFALPENLAKLVAVKGAIAVEGISLTVMAVADKSFTISIIPHTLAHTTLTKTVCGAMVNLEVDILARYVARFLGKADNEKISDDFLYAAGF